LRRLREIWRVHKELHHSSIVQISSEGVYYKESLQEAIKRISFRECRKNWVAYVNESDEFHTTDLIEDQTKCVGWRDSCHMPPYIEFFSEPRVRFVFNDSNHILNKIWNNRVSRKETKHFLTLQTRINEVGWTTYDLS